MGERERPTIKTGDAEQKQLGELAEVFLDDTWSWDVRGDRLIGAHAAALSGLGGTLDRKSLLTLVHVDDRKRLDQALDEIAGGQRDHFQLEVRVTRWNNRWATVLVRAMVAERDAQGAPVRVVGATLDVTDRIDRPASKAPTAGMIVDERLVAAQKLEGLGLLAGGIAHDFNNMLMAVVAEATMAKEEPGLTASARDALDQIETAAQRMSELTRQLLAYAGRGRFVIEKVDPDAMVQELTALLKRSIRRDGKLVLELGGAGAVIEADSTHLRQVVMNLVINASDALSPGGGTILVRSHVDGKAVPPAWILEVNDDGHGMDAATREKIFDPFFTTKVTGHGLGLSAVLGIVSQLRGTITVDSAPGKGARFAIRLPLQGGAAVEAAPRRVPGAAPLSGRRALIADDEEAVRVAVRRMLERRGAEVDAVMDGRQAREAILRGTYDLVFLDVNMPAGGAYDLLGDVRQRQPPPKIVIMSGYSESFTAKPGALADDGDAFLQKPFSLAQLDEALRALFA
jgi:signal transduction histidine kinase/CheY-like chemotaxis protein